MLCSYYLSNELCLQFLVLWTHIYIVKTKLQMCQNKVVRFILDLPPMHSINYTFLSGLNLLNVEDRVAQLRLCFFFNIYQGKAPSYLKEHLLLRSKTSSRNTRSSSNFDFNVPRIKKWQNSKERMCRLQNIAMSDYQESVTDGRTNNGQSDPYVLLCFAGNAKTVNRGPSFIKV